MTGPEWTPETIEPTTPKAIVAVPAAGRTDLRGRRLLIGLPGLWMARRPPRGRCDRASKPHIRAGVAGTRVVSG